VIPVLDPPARRSVHPKAHSSCSGEARRAQAWVNGVITAIRSNGAPGLVSSLKAVLAWLGLPAGDPRPPLPRLAAEQKEALRDRLDQLCFLYRIPCWDRSTGVPPGPEAEAEAA